MRPLLYWRRFSQFRRRRHPTTTRLPSSIRAFPSPPSGAVKGKNSSTGSKARLGGKAVINDGPAFSARLQDAWRVEILCRRSAWQQVLDVEGTSAERRGQVDLS